MRFRRREAELAARHHPWFIAGAARRLPSCLKEPALIEKIVPKITSGGRGALLDRGRILLFTGWKGWEMVHRHHVAVMDAPGQTSSEPVTPHHGGESRRAA